MKPRLVVQQKITPIVNRYEIYTAKNDGTTNELVALAEQKRFAFKEQVSFYADTNKTQLAFTFRAEKVMDIHGKFLVEDSNGNLIGAFKKEFGKSLLNSTWDILDGDVSVLIINESNQLLAAARRFAGWIPFVGDVLDLITNFFKYRFSFRKADNSEEVGTYSKTTLFRDHYQLDMTDEVFATQDWRVLASVAVALDALQSR